MRRLSGVRLRADRTSQRIASRLSERLGLQVTAEITDNTWTMISFSRRDTLCRLRLHHMFTGAPTPIVHALADYVGGDNRDASGALNRFIEANRNRIRRLAPRERRHRFSLRSRGRVHDLSALMAEVVEVTGATSRAVAIAWSRPLRVRQPRRSIKLGSYSVDTQLIRIHPVLDQAWVPADFVRWIIHHELLHHRFRQELRKHSERHPPRFRALELAFPGADRAAAWERANLDRLLRWQPTVRARVRE